METKQEPSVLKCHNIIVSAKGMTETHGTKIIIFVPAAEAGQVVLKFGRAEHRPALSLSIGIIMALIGLFGLVEFFIVPRGYRYELGMMTFGVIGGSLIFDTLKQRYFLEVDRKSGICRLVFSKQAQRAEIESFCRDVRTNYQYQIEERLSLP